MFTRQVRIMAANDKGNLVEFNEELMINGNFNYSQGQYIKVNLGVKRG